VRTLPLLRVCSLAAASLSLVLTVAPACFAQQTSDKSSYIELSWMRVRQDKLAEFGQLSARVAEANRRGKGDHWVAYQDLYGTDNQVWMVSGRQSLADIEPGMTKFTGAIKEFMGYSPEHFFAEASKTVEASGSQLWRHRFDLSWNVKDSADWEGRLAKSHYIAVITLRVRPGRMVETEKQIRTVADAVTAAKTETAGLVSQLIMGGDPGTFCVRIPLESVAGLEQMTSARQALGEEGYRNYSEMSEKDFASVEYKLKRIVPEWSSPPPSFIAANPTMWKVKAMAPAKPKPASAEPKPAASGG